jgi:uncharacterized protein (DUF2235 family)
MGKRLVLCCDGTWNRPDQECDEAPCPSNVVKMALAVADGPQLGTEQRVYYQRGVGTNWDERIRGGAFGWGLSRGVKAVYRFVVQNYEPGDELFFFGFSRGAYMARSTVGLIRNAGILKPEHADQLEAAYALYRERTVGPRDLESTLFRRAFSHPLQPVTFVGVWDTVGALGIPVTGIPGVEQLNSLWGFHDTQLSSMVKAAYQALAIDERRQAFTPAIWDPPTDATGDQTVEQVWFTGSHSDVGGGYPDTGLSDLTLGWMAERARAQGLVLVDGAFEVGTTGDQESAVAPFDPNPDGTLHNSRTGVYRLLPEYVRPIGETSPATEYASSTAIERMTSDPGYDPVNLDAYLAGSHQVMPIAT